VVSTKSIIYTDTLKFKGDFYWRREFREGFVILLWSDDLFICLVCDVKRYIHFVITEGLSRMNFKRKEYKWKRKMYRVVTINPP
jgi:hypothetical protein